MVIDEEVTTDRYDGLRWLKDMQKMVAIGNVKVMSVVMCVLFSFGCLV